MMLAMMGVATEEVVAAVAAEMLAAIEMAI